MLPDGAIHADHIWKRFRPDRVDSLLRYEIERITASLRHRELNWQWALRDINLRVEPGEAVALVGNNGSGKSTLLKILTGVMDPYAGRVETAGRIGALIEVRAGIQPDLTGRENLFLYGTLLGLNKKQVAARFDEIVAFAQLEEAIDRQVKFYSTGMQMRLGFAVAAYLEPDILLVDEVLAVGDAAFQARCLDRMREVLAQGTTLVFVSHDLHAVSAICNRALWLRDGVEMVDAPVQETLHVYREAIDHAAAMASEAEGDIAVSNVRVVNPDSGVPMTQQPLDIELSIRSDRAFEARVFVGVSEGTADPLFSFRRLMPVVAGTSVGRFSLPRLPLPRGRFYVWASVGDSDANKSVLPWHPVAQFDVFGPDLDKTPKSVVRRGAMHVEYSFESSEVSSEAGLEPGLAANGP